MGACELNGQVEGVQPLIAGIKQWYLFLEDQEHKTSKQLLTKQVMHNISTNMVDYGRKDLQKN